ncbi:hypothetical protein BYT27DRAFT_7249203 [Phlegmacium glaucopus]|nr:hypothetical protein BYT27DRAFT_7249203 [Phlegmacium glaucopus]
MSIKRFIFVLLLSLLYGSIVLAAPMPLGAADVRVPGQVLAGRPKNFDPKEAAHSMGKHPVVVLTHPDANGHVKVSDISHNPPAGSNTKLATEYGLPSHQKNGPEHQTSLNAKTINYNNPSQ